MRDSDTTRVREAGRLQIGLYVCLVLVMIVLSVREWDNYSVGVFLDDGQYVVLAQSLIHGAQYGWYFLPKPLQLAHLPFGFPLLLVPFTALFPGQVDLLRFISLGATIVSMSLLFWGWRTLAPGFSYRWGLALLALFAISPLTILFATLVMSEAPFLAWSLAAILCAERLARGERGWNRLWFAVFSLGMVYTRTIGWALLGALVLYLVIRLKRQVWRPLSVLALAFVMILGLLVAATPLRTNDLVPGEYSRYLVNFLSNRTSTGIPSGRTYWQLIGPGLLNHLDISDWLPLGIEEELEPILSRTGLDSARYIPGILLAALLIYGGVVWYRISGLTAFWLVTPPYILALFFWSWVGSRFFYPIQLQLLFALMVGIVGVVGAGARLLPGTHRVRGLVLAALLGGLVVVLLWLDLRSGSWFLSFEVHGADVEWIQRETPRDAVFLTTRPTTYHLYVDRQFIPVPEPFLEEKDIVRQIRNFDVDYVIAASEDHPLTTAIQQRTQRRTRLLIFATELAKRGVLIPRFSFAKGDAVIYQVDRAKLALEPQ